MTTCEPGASEVLTQGLVSNPNSTAFLAKRPAPIKTFGFEVFVQDVIAAINIDPSLISKFPSFTFETIGVERFVVSL